MDHNSQGNHSKNKDNMGTYHYINQEHMTPTLRNKDSLTHNTMLIKTLQMIIQLKMRFRQSLLDTHLKLIQYII